LDNRAPSDKPTLDFGAIGEARLHNSSLFAASFLPMLELDVRTAAVPGERIRMAAA
jgi:hypothetical protein